MWIKCLLIKLSSIYSNWAIPWTSPSWGEIGYFHLQRQELPSAPPLHKVLSIIFYLNSSLYVTAPLNLGLNHRTLDNITVKPRYPTCLCFDLLQGVKIIHFHSFRPLQKLPFFSKLGRWANLRLHLSPQSNMFLGHTFFFFICDYTPCWHFLFALEQINKFGERLCSRVREIFF